MNKHGDNDTISRISILRESIVLLVAVVIVLSMVAVSADTMDKLENNGNYVNSSSIQNMNSDDSLFLQLPHDPGEDWSMATTDTGAGYIMYENFWAITEPIGDIHWWGLTLKFTGSGWQAGEPNNLVFDIKFYADDPNDPDLPDELVATFTNVVPPTITGTGQYYSSFEMYYFDGVELDALVNLSEGWVSINSKSSGQGQDWLLWASAKTGDGFSYQEGASPPGRYFDQAMDLTGEGSMPPETPQRPDGPTDGVIGIEYTFYTSTTDPEEENVSYLWDWDDETPTEWTDFYDSGVTVYASHIWTEEGYYNITVNAKDINDVESDWSDPKMIHIISKPILEIGNITGGIGKIRVVIKNTGSVDAISVDWNLALNGGFILLGGQKTGRIGHLPAHSEISVYSDLILGFGNTMVTACAEILESSDTEEQDAFVFLFFIKMINE